MLFSSMTFIYIFLPIVILLIFLVKKEYANSILLIASLVFYAWGEPRFIAVMLFSILINYLSGVALDWFNLKVIKKVVLLLSVVLNISILIYFKYTNFIVETINDISKGSLNYIDIVMPIGISFFTFQAMSYVIDVYRKKVEAQKNIYKLALYISFFPQLIAGPIVKYHDIHEQINKREIKYEKLIYGIRRFVYGLGKKVLLANTFGEVVDKIFANDLNMIDYKIAWLGAICYTLQLYFDFSGYSDMAIGLGKIFGFDFLENFNYPYISKSITEFWRRWHISLSTWFKEYVYIPLGGNRKGTLRTYINLIIVFFVTGLWHGANWSFVIWGLYHGTFLIFERILNFGKLKDNKINKVWRYFYTLIVVMFGWVIFRAENISYALGYIKKMILIEINVNLPFTLMYYVNNKLIIVLIIGIIASTGVFRKVLNQYEYNNLYVKVSIYIGTLIIFILSSMYLASSTYNPFIYFRF